MKEKIQGKLFGKNKRECPGINILQFTPYFPPHKGGLETVAEEIADNWIKKGYGEVINITFDVGQEKLSHYNQKGYKVYLLPSFDIIPNFPVPKIWKKDFWNVIKKIKQYSQKNTNIRVITHTRFFLSSLIGGIFARKNKIKWIHIEHGSDYVKLSSKIKSKISYYYDNLIGTWIFKKADIILAISKACKNFIVTEFIRREVEIFYRGVDFIDNDFNKPGEIKIVFIGRLVTLKGVNNLIEAYKQGKISNELIIIGDGEEKNKLENNSKGYNIKFLGYKNRDFIITYLSENNCILVNPSYQEGMPTTVMEGLMTKNIVVATDVGGTCEISDKDDLQLVSAGDIREIFEKIKYSLNIYKRLVGKSYSELKEKFERDNRINDLYDNIR